MPKFPQNDGMRSAKINNSPKYKKAEENAPLVSHNYEVKDINLGNAPTNFLGRSQVQKAQRFNLKNFEAQMVENIKQDMLSFKSDKKTHLSADAIFESAYRKASIEKNPDAYGHAVNIQHEFLNEFKD